MSLLASRSPRVSARLRQLRPSNIRHIYTNLPATRLRWPPTRAHPRSGRSEISRSPKGRADVRPRRSEDEHGLSDPGHHESMGARRSRTVVIDGQAGAVCEKGGGAGAHG